MTTVRVRIPGEHYDVRAPSFWWLMMRWRWAIKRNRLLRITCADKPRWFNARQIIYMTRL